MKRCTGSGAPAPSDCSAVWPACHGDWHSRPDIQPYGRCSSIPLLQLKPMLAELLEQSCRHMVIIHISSKCFQTELHYKALLTF